jgi:hypothetical protein
MVNVVKKDYLRLKKCKYKSKIDFVTMPLRPQDDPSLVRIFSSDDPDLKIFPLSWRGRSEDVDSEEDMVRRSWLCMSRRH